jgi:hypothetical protein
MVEQTRESLSNMSEGDLEHLFRRRHYKSADDTGGDSDDDDDDEYESDDEEDYHTENEGDGEVKQRRLRQRSAWKPVEGTAVRAHLKQFEQKINGDKKSGQTRLINNVRDDVMRGKQWFGPESDPLSTGSDTDPDAWCLSQLCHVHATMLPTAKKKHMNVAAGRKEHVMISKQTHSRFLKPF